MIVKKNILKNITSKNSIKSIVSFIGILSPLNGSLAVPSSSHLMGAGFPVPAVLCQVLSKEKEVWHYYLSRTRSVVSRSVGLQHK